ncbi:MULTISPECIES: bifunctional 2-polyprenyl-6-hydroxyphenol methylase/3-demethylubiquinol 3-O-methyltransferase UbiG [Paraburkholderia]|uniref:class I SAM-dependent methyltransferase n=1 Tax=Paraburkholderia TaxID=1822464 RepID=UPI00225307EE|nr:MULTISPECIES: class I SAM-dependent methyltransferase [Paraburkholderia]MCX4162800.1 class I SAM-dependent methyltransferase [Paraburkholderia megapolitana]MDN7158295.1 class I SAM-dependent methyltransferase [Paraburkholderia sp. CHISQ3]MDQ6495342.1 class I SAM-dependent methyltransferase [Paraburkholderia megapolitana]
MRTMIDPILNAPSPKFRILDIGTGRGSDAVRLAEAGHTVTAMDLCRLPEWDAIEMSSTIPITFIQQDFLDWEGADPFDVVIDNGCFHHQHIDKVGAYLDRIRDLMIPGGIFMLSVFHDTTSHNDFEIVLSDRRLVRIYTVSTLSKLLAKYGFEVMRLEHCQRASKAFPYDYLYVTAARDLP